MNQNNDNQEDLSVAKEKGVAEFGLSQEQVNSPAFTPQILDTMAALKTMSPETDGPALLEMANDMPDYQVRAISEQGIAPQQLGLSIEDGQLIQPQANQLDIKPDEAALLAATLDFELPKTETQAMGQEQLGGLGKTESFNDIPLPQGVTPLNEADNLEFLKFAASMALEGSVQQYRELQQQDNLTREVTGNKENKAGEQKEDTKINMNAFLTPSAPKVAQGKESEDGKGIKSSSDKKNTNKQTQPKPKRKGPKF